MQEPVGTVTGSKEWQESGKKDAQEGINEMKVSLLFDFHFVKMCSRYVNLGISLADVLGNRQRMQQKPRSQRRAVLVEGLRSWRARRRAVKAWKRRDWRGRRRRIERGDDSYLMNSTVHLVSE
jgi:hypothetical protein